MDIIAELAPNQNNLGYQFMAADGSAIGSRITSGISVSALDDSVYSADATVPSGAVAVTWSDSVTGLKATEDLRDALAVAALPTAVEVRQEMDANSTQLAKLDASTITVVSPVSLSGNEITARPGDSWSLQLTGLGDISDRASLVFAIKDEPTEDDARALLLIDLDGLQTLARASYDTSSNGSITIDDEDAGDITLAVDEAATLLLTRYRHATWAVKLITSGGTATTLASGPFQLAAKVIDQTT